MKLDIIKNKDPRNFQILFLSCFLFYGYAELEWDFPKRSFLFAIGGSILFQTIAILIKKLKWNSLKSAIISSLGLLLLLKTNEAWLYLLGAFLIVASKFFIQARKKHIFNPVNFAIILCLLLSNVGWISPGQWGSNSLYLFIVGVFGLLVLVKVKQLANGLVFLGTLALLEFVYLNLYLGWPLDYTLHKFSNGALLLFSFFMITDPRTTPNFLAIRIVWAAIVAGISFYLMEFHYIHSAPFWVLFFISPLTPVLNYFSRTEHFEWDSSEKEKKKVLNFRMLLPYLRSKV